MNDRRTQQQDDPRLLANAQQRAAFRESARRSGQALQDALGLQDAQGLPVPGPPSMQPGQPVPQLVSAETLDQLTHLLTERMVRGDQELAGRIARVEEARERFFTEVDLEVRLGALVEAKDHVRRLLASKDHRDVTLTVDQRIDYELRIARFLLDQG